MKFAVLERLEGRLRDFLAFCKNVAGLPSIFCSVVMSYNLLLKSWDLLSSFFPVFFLMYSSQSTVQYFSCVLLMPHGAEGFLHIQLTALLFLFCALVSSLFAAGCDSLSSEPFWGIALLAIPHHISVQFSVLKLQNFTFLLDELPVLSKPCIQPAKAVHFHRCTNSSFSFGICVCI